MTPQERLEQASWDYFWRPPDVRVLDRPELLALGVDRDVGYLNTVYRTRASAARLPALVDEVIAFHRARSSRWMVVDTVPTGSLVDALGAAGYARGNEHDTRILAVDRFAARSSTLEVRRITDRQTLIDGWSVMDAAFAVTPERSDADLAAELERCAPPQARIQRYVAYLDGEPVSSGGLNVFPELGVGMLWGGGTVPHARGRGAYSAVVRARISRTRALGIPFVGLYARRDTSSPIVATQGFVECGRMVYFSRMCPG